MTPLAALVMAVAVAVAAAQGLVVGRSCPGRRIFEGLVTMTAAAILGGGVAGLALASDALGVVALVVAAR